MTLPANPAMQARPDWFDPAQIRLGLLDLDGTLIDAVPDIVHALNAALSACGAHQAVSAAQVRQWVGRGSRQLIDCVVAASGLPQEKADNLLEAYLQHYGARPCRDSVVYPGVMAFLEQARAQGWQLVCITNKNAGIANAVLRGLGICPYLSGLVGGDTLPQRKPDPAALLLTMQQTGIGPSQTVMIGDSRHDVEAARRAGVRSIAVTYGYNHGEPVAHSQPDWLLDSLTQIF